MKTRLSLDHLSRIAERLRGLDHRARSDREIEDLLSELIKSARARFFGFIPSSSLYWIRACRLQPGERLLNLSRLIYPPNPPRMRGRANLIGQQVLYAASNRRVALDEVAAVEGDRFGAIYIRQRADHAFPLRVIGEIEAIINSGRSLVGVQENVEKLARLYFDNHESTQESFFADSVLAELFRKPTSEYKATAILADKAYRRGNGIVFPSVRTIGGINLALPARAFDLHYEIVYAEQFIVRKYFGNSCYSIKLRAASCVFESDGSIRWHCDQDMPWRVLTTHHNVNAFVGPT